MTQDEILDGFRDDVNRAWEAVLQASDAFTKAFAAYESADQTLSDAIARRKPQSIELTPMQVIALAERKAE